MDDILLLLENEKDDENAEETKSMAGRSVIGLKKLETEEDVA